MRRTVLHLVMLALLMTVLARSLTGDRVHEAAGVLLLAMLAAHTMAKRRWYLALSKGPWNLRRAASATVNLSLIAAMTTVLFTVVPISRFIFGFLAIDNGMWVAQLHIAAALWLFVLVSVHLGFHWETVKRALLLPADGAVTNGGRIGRCGPAESRHPGTAGPLPASCGSILIILACGLGARACFNRNIDKIGQEIGGKVAIKIHTGEPNGPNILPRLLVKTLQQHIPNSNLVETNTLYPGARKTTVQHRKTIKTNGWTFCPVDIMDEDGAVMLPIKGGKHFNEMSVGRNLLTYDAMVVLTHFKGHAMGGFGGSMKNISIGCADGPVGKKMIHAAPDDQNFDAWLKGEEFQENMVESAKATIDHFGKHIVYINVLRNMSVDCDCAGIKAAPVKARNLGILASTDLLAVDQASIDMVYKLPEHECRDLKERIESRKGLRQLTYMKELGMGNDQYELVPLD